MPDSTSILGMLATVPAGREITVQAGMIHFEGTRGETVIEVSGEGPWGITFLDPTKDPARATAR